MTGKGAYQPGPGYLFGNLVLVKEPTNQDQVTKKATKRDTLQVATHQDVEDNVTTQDKLDNQCTAHDHNHNTNQLQFTEDNKNTDQDHTPQAHKKVTTQDTTHKRATCQERR